MNRSTPGPVFWLKKMALLRQIPFDDRLVRAGLDSVDAWLCTTGGAGSNMLKKVLDPAIRVRSPYMAALLTHFDHPFPYHRDGFRAIYLHAHPFEVLRSVRRRGLLETNIKKLNNRRDLGDSERVFLESLERQFRNWTSAPVDYPVLCIKYDALFERFPEVADFLGIGLETFPERKDRRSGEEAVGAELLAEFDGFARKWHEFPDLVVRCSNS